MDPVSANGHQEIFNAVLTSLSAQTAALSNYLSGATKGRPERLSKCLSYETSTGRAPFQFVYSLYDIVVLYYNIVITILS